VRFLIVDDDESIHLYLKTVLNKFAQCDCVSTGEDALIAFESAHLSGIPYDVVMMDILMPGMDGHETAEMMRCREKELQVPRIDAFKLVMITSLVDDMNVSKAFFNTQASCYIVKPLDKDKVIDELRRNLILE
jgi:two-component system chemotaxis response regulator CheY